MTKNKGRKGPVIPDKICPACGRNFFWQKKWEKNWENVKFCSDKCRQGR